MKDADSVINSKLKNAGYQRSITIKTARRDIRSTATDITRLNLVYIIGLEYKQNKIKPHFKNSFWLRDPFYLRVCGYFA